MAVSFISKRAFKRFTKRLTAKQLAASRRNIKKAIAARARRTGASVVKTAKNPVGSYVSSVSRRTTKRRTKALSRTSAKLRQLKAANPKLSSRLQTATREARIASGAKASKQYDFDVLNKIYQSNQAALDKRGNKGILGYVRARNTRKSLKKANEARAALRVAASQEASTRRSQKIADRLVALNEKQTSSLTNSYTRLSKGNTLGGYSGTVARDTATVSAITAAGYAGYRQSEKKNK